MIKTMVSCRFSLNPVTLDSLIFKGPPWDLPGTLAAIEEQPRGLRSSHEPRGSEADSWMNMEIGK
jgi:hypothetical protein